MVLLVAPELIPFLLIGGLIYWVIKNNATFTKAQDPQQQEWEAPQQKRKPYTNLDQHRGASLFCKHKDKSVHNVLRGKEIDPWDRPDIDISKYQHRE